MINLLESSDEEEEFIRRPRVFTNRINFEVDTDFQFKEKFRVSKHTAEYILNEIGNHLEHTTARNYALSPKQQLLTVLHWLGTGCQYHAIADMHGISKSTVTRCVQKICHLVNDQLFPKHVRYDLEFKTKLNQIEICMTI